MAPAAETMMGTRDTGVSRVMAIIVIPNSVLARQMVLRIAQLNSKYRGCLIFGESDQLQYSSSMSCFVKIVAREDLESPR